MRRSLLALATLTLLLGSTAACQTQGTSPGATRGAAADDGEESEKSEKPEKSEKSSPLGGLGSFGPLGSMMASKLDEPGPYDPPRSSPGFAKDKPHWLTMKLSGEVSELKTINFSLTGGSQEIVELQPLLARLDEAAADPQVRGLLLSFDPLSIDPSAVAELQGGLERFKGDGAREVACHFDMAMSSVYQLATACDRLGISPHGMITIAGAAATPIHLKGLLDRLGVIPDFIHIGAYKGAAEPLTRTAPSKEMEETLRALVDQFYVSQRQSLIDGRKLGEAAATAAIDRALFSADDAKEAGLVDTIAVYETFRAEIVGDTPWTRLRLSDPSEAFDMGKLQVFLGLMPPPTPKEPHVALVYALGGIVDGDGDGHIGARGEIAGRTLATVIRRLADDDKVAAIVLRINSGGGSAIASEQITQAILAAKTKKPVIASMGRVAASGGYYIASNATTIYALPDTITGSIGVVGGKITIDRALERLGIQSYHFGRGERSGIWSLLTPWTSGERETMRGWMEQAYALFLERVASGRKSTPEAIHEVAQGRVWSGVAAKERGLVDKLGGLDEALAEARTLAKIDPSIGLEIYPPEPSLRDIVQALGPVSAPLGVEGAIRGVVAELAATAGPRAARTVGEALDGLLSFRQQGVQARLIFPVMFD